MVWNHVLRTRWCTCSEDVSRKTCHHISTHWHNLPTTVCWHPGGTSPLFCWDVVGVARQPTSSMCFTIWCSLLALSTRYLHIFCIIIQPTSSMCFTIRCSLLALSTRYLHIFCIIIHAVGDLYVFAGDMIIPLILIFKGVCDLQTWSFWIDGGLGCSLPSDHPKQTGSWVPNCCMNLLSLSLNM